MPVKKDILSLIKTKDYDGLECELRNLKTNKKFLNETLKWACFQGDEESVGILIKFGANPNYADEFGTTVLHFAVKGKNQDVIIALVNFGSNYNEWECEGINLEQWCVRNGMIKVLNFLFTKFDCDLTKSDEIGRNYLHLACMFGQVKVVQYILATGLITVDERDENGWTPLHYACSEASSNFKDIIEVLFKYNADPLLLTANNKTSLDLAYESGHAQSLIDVLTIYKMLQLLISADSVIVGKMFANSRQTNEMEKIERKTSAKAKDFHLSSKLQDRDITLKLSIWRKVILNDDIELLEEYRDSGIWYNSDNPASFEESQQLTPQNLSEIFQDCFENGVGMFSYFNETFGKHINRCGFADILTNVSGVSQFCSLKTENYTLIGSFQESIVFLSFITGRFKLVEMLLKMLQFDIIPACLIICLVIRKLKSVKKFPQQIIDSLNILAYKSEHIAVDVLNRVYFKDNSPEKQVTLQFLHTQLSSYGNKSLVDLADAANCSNFLSLPCCQLILDKQWYGNIRSVRSHLKWVIRFLPVSILIYNPYHNKKLVTLNNETLKAKIDQIDNIKLKSIKVAQLNKVKNPESQMNRFQVFYAVINAPGTKFFYHSVAHFFFLIILSYILLFDFHVNIDWKEILCYSFVLGYAIEEVHQCVLISLQTTIREYICDKWNWLDIAAILTTVTGLCLRLIAQHYLTDRYVSPYEESMDKFLYISRVALLSSLLLFYLRMLFIASISAILGPKLKMIADMLRKDFLPLLLLFLIFILAFGVLFQGLLYPNGWYHINNSSKGLSSKKVSESKIEIIGLLLKRAIYGIFEPDFPIDETQCENADYCVHPLGRILFLSLSLITCIVIIYIMLMNLLIALFSNTVARIDQRSIEHWLADRFKLIEEYKKKSIFPPPFNTIERCLNIILRLFKSPCCNHTTSYSHKIICKPEAEVNSVVKFIIIQSFALKSSRHLLGSKSSRKISLSNDNAARKFVLQVKVLKDQVQKMDSKLDKILTSISCENELNNLNDNEEQIFPKISNLKYQEFQVIDESRRNNKISDPSSHSTKDKKIAKSKIHINNMNEI